MVCIMCQSKIIIKNIQTKNSGRSVVTSSAFRWSESVPAHKQPRSPVSYPLTCRCPGGFGVQRHGEGGAGRPGHHEGGDGSQSSCQAAGSGRYQIHLPVRREYLQQWVTHTRAHTHTHIHIQACNTCYIFQLKRLFTT